MFSPRCSSAGPTIRWPRPALAGRPRARSPRAVGSISWSGRLHGDSPVRRAISSASATSSCCSAAVGAGTDSSGGEPCGAVADVPAGIEATTSWLYRRALVSALRWISTRSSTTNSSPGRRRSPRSRRAEVRPPAGPEGLKHRFFQGDLTAVLHRLGGDRLPNSDWRPPRLAVVRELWRYASPASTRPRLHAGAAARRRGPGRRDDAAADAPEPRRPAASRLPRRPAPAGAFWWRGSRCRRWRLPPAYLLDRGIADFWALAVVFGIAFAGVDAPLPRAPARILRSADHGDRAGAAAMLSSHGHAPRPVAGGWAFDAFGDFGWICCFSDRPDSPWCRGEGARLAAASGEAGPLGARRLRLAPAFTPPPVMPAANPGAFYSSQAWTTICSGDQPVFEPERGHAIHPGPVGIGAGLGEGEAVALGDAGGDLVGDRPAADVVPVGGDRPPAADLAGLARRVVAIDEPTCASSA